jgi:hypothetical protein
MAPAKIIAVAVTKVKWNAASRISGIATLDCDPYPRVFRRKAKSRLPMITESDRDMIIENP